jgi:methyl-accepting chemotaxis protein
VIASEARDQAAAIDQINIGIEQIVNVVQTNSATAEETAASSEELSAQAMRMKQLVNRFKLKLLS